MCVRLGLNQTQTFRKIQEAYQGSAMSRTQCRFWWLQFTEDPDRSTQDVQHPGQPKTVWIQKAQAILDAVQEEGRSTTREIARQVGVSHMTVSRVLSKDHKFVKIAPKFVPKVLTDEQKRFRVQICRDNLAKIHADPNFLNRVVTTD